MKIDWLLALNIKNHYKAVFSERNDFSGRWECQNDIYVERHIAMFRRLEYLSEGGCKLWSNQWAIFMKWNVLFSRWRTGWITLGREQNRSKSLQTSNHKDIECDYWKIFRSHQEISELPRQEPVCRHRHAGWIFCSHKLFLFHFIFQ